MRQERGAQDPASSPTSRIISLVAAPSGDAKYVACVRCTIWCQRTTTGQGQRLAAPHSCHVNCRNSHQARTPGAAWTHPVLVVHPLLLLRPPHPRIRSQPHRPTKHCHCYCSALWPRRHHQTQHLEHQQRCLLLGRACSRCSTSQVRCDARRRWGQRAGARPALGTACTHFQNLYA